MDDQKVDAIGTPGTKYAHLVGDRAPNPGWGQSQRWHMDGQTPSVSVYDADLGPQRGDNMKNQIVAGFHRMTEALRLSAPTLTRGQRLDAQINSLPAARFFQSYTGAGTGRAYSHAYTALTEQNLHQNFNPNMQGALELHPATTYDPFPSPGSLYPKAV